MYNPEFPESKVPLWRYGLGCTQIVTCSRVSDRTDVHSIGPHSTPFFSALPSFLYPTSLFSEYRFLSSASSEVARFRVGTRGLPRMFLGRFGRSRHSLRA